MGTIRPAGYASAIRLQTQINPLMKLTFLKTPRLILTTAIACAFCTTLSAETVVTQTKTVTADGTITTFEPNSFVIRSEAAPAPLTYTYGKTIQYVDESGRVITRETIKPGAPVTVHYVRDGDHMVADRVVVRKTTTTVTEPGREPTKAEAKALREAAQHPEREARRAAERGKPFPPVDPSISKTTTTTTTTNADGTISSFAKDEFAIKSQTSDEAVTYRYTKTTQYVDENGAPVSVEVVKSGVPVTVTFVRDGNRFVAQRVIVHTTRR